MRRTVLLDSTDVPAQGALGDIGVAGKIDETVPATALRRHFHDHLKSPGLLTTFPELTVIVVNGTRRCRDYAESVYPNNSCLLSNSLLGFTKASPVLHPKQFEVNEAWIAFKLNYEPLQTEEDGSFNCICLMDAASCFILGNAMVPANQAEPSQLEARRLLKTGWEHKKRMPKTLLVPNGQFQTELSAEAKRKGIDVVSVPEDQLIVFIGEARQGFREHVQGGDSEA